MTNEERTDRWIKDDDADIPSHFFTKAELARREQAQAPQHTPGPWGVGYGEDRVITIGPYPCVVADCAPNDELSLEEVAANAALIARAPELLAENARLRSLLAEARQRDAKLLAAMMRVEYIETGTYWMCTACGSDAARYPSKRHNAGCAIAAAIETAKEAING